MSQGCNKNMVHKKSDQLMSKIDGRNILLQRQGHLWKLRKNHDISCLQQKDFCCIKVIGYTVFIQ